MIFFSEKISFHVETTEGNRRSILQFPDPGSSDLHVSHSGPSAPLVSFIFNFSITKTT